MRNHRDKDNRATANRLSKLVNCESDELVITRNTTESLDLIISGFPWKKNDEAIFASQDYGSMQEMFKLTAKRKGIKNKIISIPNHPENDQEIVSLYEKIKSQSISIDCRLGSFFGSQLLHRMDFKRKTSSFLK